MRPEFGGAYQPEVYGEVKVYRSAFEAAMGLYWQMPSMAMLAEADGLCEQLVEASRQVCTLLAEAWESRRYREVFLAKLDEAGATAAKVQTWVAFAVECGYLQAESGEEYCELYRSVFGEIERLVAQAAVVVKLAA